MRNWVVDDLGQIFSAGAPELTRTLGYTSGGRAVENYAIENMGYAGVGQKDDRVHIRCRPSLMGERTISSLFYWLYDHSDVNVVVSWLDDVWHMERAMTWSVAVAFLGYLFEKRSPNWALPDQRLLARQSVAVEQRWRRTIGETLPALICAQPTEGWRRSLDNAYKGRWTIVDFDMRAHAPSRVQLGSGYPPLDPATARDGRLFNFNGGDDPQYKSWILDNFAAVAASDRSRFEVVDAIVRWPRIGEMRTRYWRFAVPFMRADNSCRLLSVSGCDSSIDLRPNLIQVGG